MTLTLRAYDRSGKVSVSHQVVTLDNTAPVVRIAAAPANGTRRVRKTKYVTATASDRYGVRVMDLIVNGRIIQRFAGTSHRFSVPTWKFGKTMTVRVRAYDRAGNVSYTPSRTWHR